MFLKSSKGKIFCKAYGEGRPIVILHGYELDHRVMTGGLEPLFRKTIGWRRIYMDLPYMGKSQRVVNISSAEQIMDAVTECVLQITQGNKFVLVGYSFGAYLVQHLALRHPDLVAGMILLAPVIFAQAKERDLPQPETLICELKQKLFKNKDKQEWFDSLVVRTPNTWRALQKYVLPGINLRKKTALDRISHKAYSIPGDLLKPKTKCAAPVLLIAGKQDSTVGYKDALKMLEVYPRGSAVVLDKAGHNLMFEQPRLFETTVANWLKENF